MAVIPAAADRPLRELHGVVERITYQNAENGLTVARLAPERPESEAEAARGDDRLVTVVGTLADLTPGEAIVAHGWWRNDARHGWQFQARDYRTALPVTVQSIEQYLGRGLIGGHLQRLTVDRHLSDDIDPVDGRDAAVVAASDSLAGRGG